MNNPEESKPDLYPQHQREQDMTASSATIDGIAASALWSVLQRVQQVAERCGRESQRIHVVASNKLKPLIADVPNLVMVETVDDEKITNHLNRCVELAKHVSLNCPNLQFCGLMTIGMPDYTSTPENFKTLTNCRSEVCKALGIPEEQCELSMRMSGDFELAIEMGSTNVRVGSTIFGAMEYPKKK
ncbi:Tetratricopeptide repeat-like superfamily protein [Hibiscus syriacus]|uniref:Tetratricopeptide repeat-like superfamily protein n=1 Tax=Hibiscus syriacus TaxID=106335 RepID=A0A6A2XFX4_HIBSY|nr:Tetratricopeptide repeat-like superfamily protein [Hibiscus syriacus]